MAKSQTKAATNGTQKADGAEAAIPCYVLSLTVENVRCFGSEQTLKLSDEKGRPAQWTIILGENGTGKTTLLQSLVYFEDVSIQADKGGRDLVEIARLYAAVKKGVYRIDSEIELKRSQEHNLPARSTLTFVRYSKLQEATTHKSEVVSWEINAIGMGSIEPRPGKMRKSLPKPFNVFAYGTGRRLSPAAMTTEVSDDSAGTLFDEHAPLRNAEEWLLQLDYAASKEAGIQSQQKMRLEQVKQLLIAILPNVEDIRFTTTGGPYPKARAEFQTFSGWVPLRRLGYGYQTLIAWVTDFASRMSERYPDSPDPLKEPAVVLVDEIDLHLHPIWQRKLIAFLSERFPNTQFIATAHSPLVVQAAENANIAVLKRVGDHVEILNDPEQIRGWRIDQILTSDLFGLPSARSPKVEALFERKKLLLDKARRSKKDEAELRDLQVKIDRLPIGDSAHAAKEMETIREVIDLLKDQLPK